MSEVPTVRRCDCEAEACWADHVVGACQKPGVLRVTSYGMTQRLCTDCGPTLVICAACRMGIFRVPEADGSACCPFCGTAV